MTFSNQHIKAFSNHSDYAAFKESSSFLRPNVSYCISEDEVHYTAKIKASFKDYLYSDFTTSQTLDTSKTAIGVCVIPTGVLPDGKARFISLKAMSCSTPDTGSTSTSDIYWGNYDLDIPTLTNYNKVVTIVDGTSTLGSSDYGYLQDSNGEYKGTPHCPSPWSNFAAYSDMTTSAVNALSDFDGAGNTAKILAVADDESTAWRTAASITNGNDAGQYPAAQCCWRYSTAGTSQGDWYLPSMGELGFVYERASEISSAVSAAGGASVPGEYLWSSTEYSYGGARYLGNGGDVFNGGKAGNGYVFAFLAV